MQDADPNNAAHETHQPHAAPFWILMAVFVALLILTVVTVLTAKFVDLGPYNLLLAMAIAGVKGALVCLFFMHLWWDSLFNSLAIAAGIGFLALFIGTLILDTEQYKPQVVPLREVLTTDKIRSYIQHPQPDRGPTYPVGETAPVPGGEASPSGSTRQGGGPGEQPH